MRPLPLSFPRHGSRRKIVTGNVADSIRPPIAATVEAEPLTAAGRIARALDEAEELPALSVSYFDLGNGRYEVSALYGERPPEEARCTR